MEVGRSAGAVSRTGPPSPAATGPAETPSGYVAPDARTTPPTPEGYSAATRAEGQKFLAENAKKPGVQTTASGLQYQVLQAGDGPKPKATDTVRVNYRGTLLDGTEFDASAQHGGPAKLPLPQMVEGWKERIPLMPVGSKYRFWIPANLGFGEQGTPGGPIPPNATLVFDVELLGIGPQGK